MAETIVYSARERRWLGALAAFGSIAVNGAFVYRLLFRREALVAAMTNPVAAAFMLEALVLVGVFAYLLDKWRVSRLPWG